jgi:hypothetical protein
MEKEEFKNEVEMMCNIWECFDAIQTIVENEDSNPDTLLKIKMIVERANEIEGRS